MEQVVSFPGLGLTFTLNRVVFPNAPFAIYWYGVIIAIGFLLAVVWCYKRAPAFGIQQDSLFDLLIFAVPLSIVGARLYYIIFYLDLFRNEDGSLNWMKMIDIRDGGLAIYGGVIVAILVLIVFTRVKKSSFWAYGDLCVQGLLIGQLIGRWGNFVNVEAYGGVTDLPWRMCSESIANELLQKGLLDSQQQYELILNGTWGVHPTFLYESLWNLVGLILIYVLSKKLYKFDGQLFCTYLIWYGVGRGLIEGLRTDSLYFFNTPIRVSQMLGFLSAAAGAVLLILLWRRGKKMALPLYIQRVQAEKSTAEASGEKRETEGAAREQVDAEQNGSEAEQTEETGQEDDRDGDDS